MSAIGGEAAGVVGVVVASPRSADPNDAEEPSGVLIVVRKAGARTEIGNSNCR